MQVPSGTMIAINPITVGEAASAYELLLQLREEEQRIKAEIERVTKELEVTARFDDPRLFNR